MSVASQYIRGKGKMMYLPPAKSGIMAVIDGVSNPTISESISVSTTPMATESISETVVVGVT